MLTWERHVAVYGPVLVVASYLCWRMLRRIRGSEFMELAASLQDDSFYGLLPAFRFWTAGQFSFDGLGPSYGFQPAYECVLTLLAYFFDDEQSFIRGAMELNVLFYALTGVVVSALVARCLRAGAPASLLAQKIAAAASGILFLTTGTALLSATTCKENALSSLLLALALLWIPARVASKPRSSKSARRAFLFGALLATLVLTRLLPTTLVLVTVLSLLAVRRTGAWALFAICHRTAGRAEVGRELRVSRDALRNRRSEYLPFAAVGRGGRR